MEEIQLTLDEDHRGAFVVQEGNKQLAKMIIYIDGNILTAYHTEVSPKAKGKGLAKKLLENMAAYARAHQLRGNSIVPVCICAI